MNTVKVGVVGCGRNSDNHLRVYSKTDGVQLVAVCDIDPAKANAQARRFGADMALTDFDSMLRLDLDLVDVITPTSTHAELSKLALESSHNVLVEKPMAVSSEQCEMMINAARKNGRSLCVVHNKKFFDSVGKIKGIIDREKLTVTRASVSHFYTHRHKGFRPEWILNPESGGILWETLVHPIYLIEHFIGQARSTFAIAWRIKQTVDDSFTLVLQSGNGVGVCEFEWDVKEPLILLRLVTREGDRFDADLAHDHLLRRSRGYRNRGTSALRAMYDDIYSPVLKWTRHSRNFAVMHSYPAALPYEKTFFPLIQGYVSFLARASPTIPVSAEEGARTIRVLEAARNSIESGKPQVIE